MVDKTGGAKPDWCAAGGGSLFVNVCQREDKHAAAGGAVMLVMMRKAEDKRLPRVQHRATGVELRAEGAAPSQACAAGKGPCAEPCGRAGSAVFVKGESIAHMQERGAPEECGGRAREQVQMRKKEGNQQDAEHCLRAMRPRGRKRRPRSGARPAVLRCPWCGERFERHASRQRFCCRHCRRQWDNMRGCAERERARLEREAEAEEQRWRDLERERIHAGLLPWPEGLACRDGISPWERDELAANAAGAAGIWENALLDPLPVR
ncbi:hypothetical protein [Mailhella sp.]|uniref:hypothetical protein n=1 Tax=Mailhella sp. TaxID=1981029 RepID=UPI004062C0A2